MSEHFPDEPLSPVRQGYMAMHVMFEELVAAGFTEDQALKYIVYWTNAIPDTSQEPPP